MIKQKYTKKGGEDTEYKAMHFNVQIQTIPFVLFAI